MKVSKEELQMCEEIFAQYGGTELKQKVIWNGWAEKHPRLQAVIRKYAEKIAFGVYKIDEEFIKGVRSGVSANRPAPLEKPRQTADKVKQENPALVGKREIALIAQMAAAEQKTERGDILFEEALIKQGGVEISRSEAAELMKNGSMVYVVDAIAPGRLAVPAFPGDVVMKGKQTFYKKA